MPNDIIDTSSVGDLTMVHTIKPKKSLLEMFDKTRISTKSMKAYRGTLTSACSFCHKLQTDNLVCAKVRVQASSFELSTHYSNMDPSQCKVASYCSKEVRLKSSKPDNIFLICGSRLLV